MSGGSFNYLCWRNASDVFQDDALEQMADELDALGHSAKPVAIRTRALLRLRDELEVTLRELEPVWHAVEWWRSCDWSRERVYEELGAYKERQREHHNGFPDRTRCSNDHGVGPIKKAVRGWGSPREDGA